MKFNFIVYIYMALLVSIVAKSCKFKSDTRLQKFEFFRHTCLYFRD